MKIQPIDSPIHEELTQFEQVKPVIKSRLKRLFECQFSNVLRISNADKTVWEDPHLSRNSKKLNEFEPASCCLENMVQNFIEEENDEKQFGSVICGGKSCNCFNGNCVDGSDEEINSYDKFGGWNYSSSAESCKIMKSLVLSASISEKKLLNETMKIVVKNKICKLKDGISRKIVADSLLALGYDASICKSTWEKSPTYPAGEYEYIDVIINGERLLIDIDFRSEFEIARSTKAYKAILQTLPYIFVGKVEHLQKIIDLLSDATKQSLKKKGMPIPPWRKVEYMKAKWLSPYTSIKPGSTSLHGSDGIPGKHPCSPEKPSWCPEDNDLVKDAELGKPEFALSVSSGEKDGALVVTKEKLLTVKPKTGQNSVKIVGGLASVIADHH